MKKWTRLNQRGMTLVELLAVIVILGILASIGIVVMTSVIQTQKDRAFVGNALGLKEGASLYIQQEMVHSKPIPLLITYEMLHHAGIIDQFKDPDTGEFLPPSDKSYVKTDGKAPIAVCVRAEKRNLCGEDGILFSELSTDLLNTN